MPKLLQVSTGTIAGEDSAVVASSKGHIFLFHRTKPMLREFDGKDVLNWRFQAFVRTAPTGRMTTYIPSARMFWGSVPSVGWASQQTAIPYK
ncbi:MAG: hypothetical protein WBC78_01150 [Candidatus Sulfotelmatobacter sp.]